MRSVFQLRTPQNGDGESREPERVELEAPVETRVRFRESQIGTVHSGLTLEDGSLVVTGNYLKVRIPPGRTRNEWVTVRVTGGNETLTGDLLIG